MRWNGEIDEIDKRLWKSVNIVVGLGFVFEDSNSRINFGKIKEWCGG